MASEFAPIIWAYFLSRINNAYGVAGLMGNLECESGLCPYRLQGDFSDGWTTSLNYTEKVDNGTITKDDFIYNGPNGGGYGLAQWTFWTRKKALYERWKSNPDKYGSIGDIVLACDHLWYELQNDYPSVLSVLKNATSIRVASDKVLHDFENPADQSVSVEQYRASRGSFYYNLYSGNPPVIPDNPSGGGSIKKNKMSLTLMYMAIKR